MKQHSDPEGDLSPSPFILKAFIWSTLVLSDLVIGTAAAGQGFPLSEWVVFLLTVCGLLLLEFALWRMAARLFQ
jgi:hypothetical protein